MKPCFGYVRVSTLRQGEGVSLEAQREAIEQCAKERGLFVSEWFEELETASKEGRPVFNRMVARLHAKHAEGLIVHKLDRSSRNIQDWGVVSRMMDDGIEFHIATEPIDFGTRGGRIMADFLAVIAADFSRNQREETKKGQRVRLKQGLYPFKGPLGYLNHGKGKAKTPCPHKAPLIKEAYRLYASGQHSLKSLRKEMYRRGLRNHNEGKVSLHGIEKILSNPFYHGAIYIERTGEKYDGIHEPLVPKALFKRVQKIKSRRCGPKVTQHSHLFIGLFRCADCRGPLVPELQKARVYYRCKQMTCPMKTIREDRLDALIRAKLAEIGLSKDAITAMRARWRDGELGKNLTTKRLSLSARIEATETKLARAADLLVNDTLDEATYQTQRKELAFEVAQLRGELDDLPDPADIKRQRSGYVRTFSRVSKLYVVANKAEKRELLRNIFAERLANKSGVFVKVRGWADARFSSEHKKLSLDVNHSN